MSKGLSKREFSQLLQKEYNGPGSLNDFWISSTEKVSWKCSTCSFEWKAAIASRARITNGSGCPECARKNVGLRAAAKTPITDQRLFQEYRGSEPLKNYSKFSQQKMPWCCNECQFEWKSSIQDRSNGGKCPRCTKRNASLRSALNNPITNPKMFREYIGAEDLTHYSKWSKVRMPWRCETCLLEWEASISHRSQGHSCPECGKKKMSAAKRRTAAATNPIIDDLLFAEYRGEEPLSNFSKGCAEIVPWECSKCFYLWTQAIHRRATLGSSCPECTKEVKMKKQQLISAKNNPITDPLLFLEYRGTQPLYEIPSGSNIDSPWQCSVCKHEWSTVINKRTSGTGCPECAKKRAPKNRQLAAAAKNPILDPKLHREFKGPGILNEYAKGSNIKGDWQCEDCSFCWSTVISNRARLQSGCPKCTHRGIFEKGESGYLYLISDDNGHIGKIGVTKKINQRLKTHRKQRLNQVIKVWGLLPGQMIWEIEKAIIAHLRQDLDINPPKEGFNGWTETFLFSEIKEATGQGGEEYLKNLISINLFQKIASL